MPHTPRPLQVLQRLGLALTWAPDMQPFISWLPAIASVAAVEPALARGGIAAALPVAVAPLAGLCVLAAATAWCAGGMDAGGRARLAKSAVGRLLLGLAARGLLVALYPPPLNAVVRFLLRLARV